VAGADPTLSGTLLNPPPKGPYVPMPKAPGPTPPYPVFMMDLWFSPSESIFIFIRIV